MALVLRTQTRSLGRRPAGTRIWLVKPPVSSADARVPAPRVEIRNSGGGHVVRIEMEGVDWDKAEAVFDGGAIEVSLPKTAAAEPARIPITRPAAEK